MLFWDHQVRRSGAKFSMAGDQTRQAQRVSSQSCTAGNKSINLKEMKQALVASVESDCGFASNGCMLSHPDLQSTENLVLDLFLSSLKKACLVFMFIGLISIDQTIYLPEQSERSRLIFLDEQVKVSQWHPHREHEISKTAGRGRNHGKIR